MFEDDGKTIKNIEKDKDSELRIYCICGQKMRVKPEMYGKPGRCVACRQKIRIPKREEIPEGVKEIYLKDHPELLRKSSSKEKSIPLGDTSSDSSTTPSDDIAEVLPLENLEFLRYIISAEYKAQRYLDALRHKTPLGPETKSELMEYLSKIRRLRATLDEKLRIRRNELIEQYKKTEEEISKEILAFRVGEIDFETYWSLVTPLRLKREILAQRRRNVEGWLSIISPELAGGYIDVNFGKIPEKVPEVTFALEEEEYDSVLSMLINGLEKFVSRREELEHKFAEWKKVTEEGEIEDELREKGIAEFEAQLKIVRSGIAFYRERFEQLILDCDLDLESIEKNLERLQKQKEAKIIDIKDANRIETILFQARLDIGKTKDIARRAISANSIVDIPSLRGTFVARMGPTRGAVEIGIDSWLSWICSALIIMLIMIPMTSAQGLVNSNVLILIVIGLFLSALILAGVASIPYRVWRGIGLNFLFVLYVLLYTLHIYLVWYNSSPISSELRGGEIRNSPYGLLSFNIIAPYMVLSLLGVSSWISLLRVNRYKFIPAISTAISLFVLVATFTDFFGLIKGGVILESVSQTEYLNTEGQYKIEVSLLNNGLASVWIGNNLVHVPRPVFINVRKVGEEDIRFDPIEVIIESQRRNFSETFNKLSGRIKPGSKALFIYKLPPGRYIFSLDGLKGEFYPKEVNLTLPSQPIKESSNEAIHSSNFTPELIPNKNLANTQSQSSLDIANNSLFEELGKELNDPPLTLNSEEVILYYQGFAQSTSNEDNEKKDITPKFRITLWDSRKKSLEKLMGLGETLIGNWIISEFSPQRETITLRYNDKIFILKRGYYYKLKIS